MPASFVQQAGTVVSTAANTWTATFGTAVTAGNLVVIVGRMGTASRTMGTPTGGAGSSGTFASVQSIGGTAIGGLAMWAMQEAGSATAYTITIGSSLNAAGVIRAWEISGHNSATADSSGTGTQTTTTTPQMVDTGLTIPSGGIMIGGFSTQGDLNWTSVTAAPSNFTESYTSVTAPGRSMWLGYRTTSGSSITGSGTITSTRAIWGLAAVWAEAAAAGGQPFAKRWGGIPNNAIRARRVW